MNKKIIVLITACIIFLDQLVKKIIVTFIRKGEAKEFLGQIVKLNYVTNTGGAFGLRKKWNVYYNYL